MSNAAELVGNAQRAIGAKESVVAAGVFGLQDGYAAITVGGLAAGAVAGDLAGGALADGVLAAAGTHAARQVNAQGSGLTVRMLVAVTDTSIYLLALASTGIVPERQLLRFDRAATACTVTRFGASRRVKLADAGSGREVGLTGSVALFSSYAAGTKAVLAALGGARR